MLSRDIAVSGGVATLTADGQPRGPDSPQVGLEFVPEALSSLVGWHRCIADSPLRVSGQSAV